MHFVYSQLDQDMSLKWTLCPNVEGNAYHLFAVLSNGENGRMNYQDVPQEGSYEIALDPLTTKRPADRFEWAFEGVISNKWR